MPLPIWKRLHLTAVLAAGAFATQGCIYSAFQGARVLEEGKSSISPSFSIHSVGTDGESNWATTHFGAQFGAGLGSRLELQGRYERMDLHERGGDDDSDNEGANYIHLGLKYGVVQDIVAVAMPVGFMFGENVEDESETFQFHPSLFLTVPVAPILDINASAKALYLLDDMGDPLLAFNGGLGIRPGDGKFGLMPEMGLLFSPGDNGYLWHWGVGASVEF